MELPGSVPTEVLAGVSWHPHRAAPSEGDVDTLSGRDVSLGRGICSHD